MESLGQFLRKERELREISIKEIAHQTKISPFHLKALETDNFSVFPGEAFVRGFLKNYAVCIGLDANEIINRYLEDSSPKKEESPEPKLVAKPSKLPAQKNKKQQLKQRLLLFFKMLIISSLLTALFLLLNQTFHLWEF